MNKRVIKSIWAVLAGFITVFVLSSVTDLIFEALGIFPPITKSGEYATWMLMVALLYRCIATVIGGYVTAYLSPYRPMRHVIILGVIGTLGGIAGVIGGWNLSAHWYPIAIAVTGFPLIWIGGKLKTIR